LEPKDGEGTIAEVRAHLLAGRPGYDRSGAPAGRQRSGGAQLV